MASDDLDLDGKDKPTDKPTPPALDAAAVTDAVSKGMAQVTGQFNQFKGEISEYIRSLTSKEKTATNANPDPDDLTNRLLTDPKGTVAALADEWARTRLAPSMAVQINDRYEDLKDKHRSRFDDTYGTGAFDAEILPKLDPMLNQMSPEARGSSAHFQAAMRNVMGDEEVIVKLMDKRSATQRARDEAPTGILTGGRRSPDAPRLDEDTKSFLADYERATGTALNSKELESILDVRRRHGRWTTQNFPGIKNAKLEVAAR